MTDGGFDLATDNRGGGDVAVWFAKHYEIKSFEEVFDGGPRPLVRDVGVEEVAHLLPDPMSEKGWELNWLFLSTSGVHGTYGTLNDFYECYECEAKIEDPYGSNGQMCETHAAEIGPVVPTITAVVVQPRTCTLTYGNMAVRSKDDEMFLRRAVTRTLAGVMASQVGNGI